jgi:hypothetical protein
MGETKRQGLRVIPGGRSGREHGEAIRIVVATDDEPPFDVDAVALEDDTFAVLGADPEFREPDEHPIRIWTRVHELEETEPGTVVVQEGRPLKLLAVVHDLARNPTFEEGWISTALVEILREVDRRGLSHLGLEPLGCVYGRLPAERFLALLRGALETERPAALQRVWLLAPPELLDSLSESLSRTP